MQHAQRPSISTMILVSLFVVSLAVLMRPNDTEVIENASDVMVGPTEEEHEFAHTIVDNNCDGLNCFAYIASPQDTDDELYDAGSDRGRFVRLITPQGDDLAFDIRYGDIFVAIDILHCRVDSNCGVRPMQFNEGFGLIFYDAPRGDHKQTMHPNDLRFSLAPKKETP